MKSRSTNAASARPHLQSEEVAEPAVGGKTRVQFDFTPDALQRLDEIKEATGATTRAETIRNALRLYEWFVKEADPDSIVKLEDSNHQVLSQFRARLLLP